MNGKVKWFSNEKGYGFITAESGEDHHFSVQNIKGAGLPSIGDSVSFDSKSSDKGFKAYNVTISSKAPSQKNDSRDDRVNCPSCGKKIVPRMITYHGNPQKSVCPYCAAVVKQFSQCFIATAVYGDDCCPEVMELRRFRDDKLLKNTLGSCFVSTYYKVSPPIARWLKNHEIMSQFVKTILNQIVRKISK